MHTGVYIYTWVLSTCYNTVKKVRVDMYIYNYTRAMQDISLAFLLATVHRLRYLTSVGEFYIGGFVNSLHTFVCRMPCAASHVQFVMILHSSMVSGCSLCSQ